MPLVLVVDDEPAIRASLAFALGRDGFAVREAASLAEARAALAGADLVVLDLGLPDGSGLELLRSAHVAGAPPIIVLTSRDEETDRVVGLELGADDYVTKPFSPRELVARARAVLRRAGARPAEPPAALPPAPPATAPLARPPALPPAAPPLAGPGGLVLDRTRRRATVGGRALELSRLEFDLLAVLLGVPGRVLERGQLLDAVWSEAVVGERTVDVHVKALRQKIEAAGGDPAVIETVRGIGYRLREA